MLQNVAVSGLASATIEISEDDAPSKESGWLHAQPHNAYLPGIGQTILANVICQDFFVSQGNAYRNHNYRKTPEVVLDV
ncbi:hypothetical protein TMatcc_009086 [Talaromyces marneffei ATCC 18224]